MDLLRGCYESNNEEDEYDKEEQEEQDSPNVSMKVQRADRRYLRVAPSISLLTKRKHAEELIVRTDPNTGQVVTEPIQGPQMLDPLSEPTKTGKVQDNIPFDERYFKKQRNLFQREGRAMAPSNDGNSHNDEATTSSVVVRTTLGYNPQRLAEFQKQEQIRSQRPKFDQKQRKEDLVHGSDDEALYGVWAPPSQQELWQEENQFTDIQKHGLEGLQPEQLAEREYIQERDRLLGVEKEEKEQVSGFERLMERKMAHLLPPKSDNDKPIEPSTTFHGTSETNYKGQSWMVPPSGLGSIVFTTSNDETKNRCRVPKKCTLRFQHNSKGVQRIRLFPKTGHLLLSGGLDGTCKVFSLQEKQLMRTYHGHAAAVRDVQFNHSGDKFISASFDRYLRLWDTESGNVLQTFGNGKVPYCIAVYPHDDNYFCVGCSDNKIVTYDATTAEITQEYNHHLAPINSILFVDENDNAGGDAGSTKMVTSSDDKKILVWEWDIGVPIKYISDPTMHSMPSLVMHPTHQYFVGQSLDNSICVFEGNRFKLQKKKKFSGHQVAGYACEPAFSPDGQFLISGDGKGRLLVWDWKRTKLLQQYKAHDNGPAIACVWHPLEPSTVFTCGWDGVIKMWQ